MKKTLSLLLAALLLTALCACGEGGAAHILFQNDTDTALAAIYLCPPDEIRGDALNSDSVAPGGAARLDAALLANGPGSLYDVYAIDEGGMRYELYEIPVNDGDAIALSADGDTAVFTVSTAEGGIETYYGWAYAPDA